MKAIYVHFVTRKKRQFSIYYGTVSFPQVTWRNIFEWIKSITKVDIKFDIEEILFGANNSEEFKAFNTIFIVTKYCIYFSRSKETIPNSEHIIKKIKYVIGVEKFIAAKNEKLTLHNKKWSLFQNC